MRDRQRPRKRIPAFSGMPLAGQAARPHRRLQGPCLCSWDCLVSTGGGFAGPASRISCPVLSPRYAAPVPGTLATPAPGTA